MGSKRLRLALGGLFSSVALVFAGVTFVAGVGAALIVLGVVLGVASLFGLDVGGGDDS